MDLSDYADNRPDLPQVGQTQLNMDDRTGRQAIELLEDYLLPELN